MPRPREGSLSHLRLAVLPAPELRERRRMIDTTLIERELRSMKRWQGVMIVLFGLNVYLAALNITTPHSLGVALQALAIVLNIAGAVVAWDTVKRGERICAELRRMLERARRFNRIFFP